MNNIKKVAIVFFALVLTLLDVSFFSSMPIYDATIVTTFLFVITISLLLFTESFILFAAAAIIFFSIFSSLPAWILVVSFFCIPEIIFYLRKTVVPEPTVPISFFFFIVVNTMFELMLLIYSKEFGRSGFAALGYFVLINSVAGTTLYFISKMFRDRFKISEVKI